MQNQEAQNRVITNDRKTTKNGKRIIKVIPRNRERMGTSKTIFVNPKMEGQENLNPAKEIEEIINFYSSEDLESGHTIKEEIDDENKNLSDNLDGIYHPSDSVNSKRVEALNNEEDEENLDLGSDGLYGEKGVLKEEVFGDFGFLNVPNPDFGHKLKNFSDNKVL